MASHDPNATSVTPEPPGSWARARRLARVALTPVERFLAIEAASGIILVIAAAVALVWANSPWADTYQALWHTPIGFTFGSWTFERDLHFWINDGLMAVFFFVVGLEIRREMHKGVLSDFKRASLPLAAALGGMLVPALIYTALNAGAASASGWGVPMATDIAFAVGVLALLGKRVPPALRILLLALAVIDDLGAILVIAIFYSEGLSGTGFLVAALGVFGILLMQGLGVRKPLLYVPAALVVWGGTYAAGVHPTVAGVIIGLMTPVRAWFDREALAREAEASAATARADDDLHGQVHALQLAGREVFAPAERLEHALHGWVAWVIMPLFALANAGVPLGGASFDGVTMPVVLGVILGLGLGKPIGIMLFAWACVRLRLSVLPAGITWRHVLVVGLVAGIGFTMAIFIAQLAFPAGAMLEAGKLAILIASGLVAVIALFVGKLLLTPTTVGAATETEAESAPEPGP